MMRGVDLLSRLKWLVACAATCAAACAPVPHKDAAVKLNTVAPLAGMDLGTRSGAVWPAAKWWEHYADPTLNQIVDLGLATAPSLSNARARFDTARASVREAGANVGARVDLDASYTRQRLSDNGLFPPAFLGFHWYDEADLGLKASYTFDWWGKQHAAIESAVDAARAREAEGVAAQLALVSSIVDTYFGWQLDQSRLQVARQRVDSAQRQEAIAAARIRAELESPDSLNEVHALAGAAREQLAVLEGSARLRIVALAALVGVSAGQLPALTPRPLPAIAAELPDDVGIDLLARRPDIVASRWRVEAAEKSVTAARSDFYPDVSLRALAGVQSLKLSKLLEIGSGVPLVGAAVHLPVFDAGRLSARYGFSRAQLQSAVADYDDAVNGAARDVATQASNRQQLLAQQRERNSALMSAQSSRKAAQARVHAGVTDLRPQLTAEQNELMQADAVLQLQGEALSVDIALQRALGGGYGADARLVSNTQKTP
jgi:NodT family efflux transporter outer membrane factor (OMF) lipoprotein